MPTCRSCKAKIRWAVARATGRPMPVDRVPTPRGTLVLEYRNGGYESRVADATDRQLKRQLYTSHFATCPDARSWRSD